MSIKETLGLRTHKEDHKMFWFELTLLFLLPRMFFLRNLVAHSHLLRFFAHISPSQGGLR